MAVNDRAARIAARTAATAARAADAPGTTPTATAAATAAGAAQTAAVTAAAAAAAMTPPPVMVSAMDTYIPNVPEVSAKDIMARFKTTTLTKIEGEPTYIEMDNIRDELYRNAMAIKSCFGGGKLGHLGMIMQPVLYTIEAGEAWSVAQSSGTYPTFAPGATEHEKKAKMATFIVVEKAIKVEDVMQNLLRNQVLKAVDPEYYMELEHSIFQYDQVSVMELLTHLFKNYAKIDDQLLENNKELYAEAPDLSKPIDMYFRK